MNRILLWAGVALLTGVGLFLIWFGLLYANVMGVLWFHAAALPDTELETIRPLYFALMRLIGAASAALGVIGIFTALVALPRRVPFAGAALALSYAIVFVVAGYTAEKLAAETGAPTSFAIMGVLFAVTAAGYGLYALARRGE